MGGKEREDLGSKCLAGLNVLSWSCHSMIDCDSARNRNHTNDRRHSNNSNVNVSNVINNSNHDNYNNDNNHYKNNHNYNNNDNSDNNNNNDNNTRNYCNKSKSDDAESVLVLSRPYKKVFDRSRFVKGDRVLISVERNNKLKQIQEKKTCQNTEPSGIMAKSKINTVNLEKISPLSSFLCDDIEDIGCRSNKPSSSPDLGYSNDNRNNIKAPHTTDNTIHRNGLAFIEPNVAVGQILQVTEIKLWLLV